MTETDARSKEDDVDLIDIYHVLDEIVPPGGEPWTFGEFKKLPVVPGLHVNGVGDVPLPMTSLTAKELQRVGCESEAASSFRQTIQIPGDQVTLKNPAWKAALSELTWKIAGTLGVNQTLVYPKLHKVLVYQEGSLLEKHDKDNEEKSSFAKLMIQLPSSFTGATYNLSNKGEKVWTHSMDMPEAPYECRYISHYADCEHGIPPIESGHLLVLEFSLCYRGREMAKPNLDSLKNGHVVSLMQRLPKSKTLFVIPLDNPNPPARREVSHLTGPNKKFTNRFSNATGWELAFAKLKKSEKGDPYLSCWYPQTGKYACRTKSWMSESFNFSSVEDGGMVLSSRKSFEQKWHQCTSGNQDAANENEYFTNVLIAFKSRDSFDRLLCLEKFRVAVSRIEKNFDRLKMAIDFLRRERNTVVLKHDTFSELRQVVLDMYGETESYWRVVDFLFQRLTIFAVPPGFARAFIGTAIKQHGNSDQIKGMYSYLQRLSNYDKNQSSEYLNEKTKFFEALYEETGWFHVAKVQQIEKKYLLATEHGRPVFSWRMPGANTNSHALNSFLHGDEEGPKEVIVGGGIENARQLCSMQEERNADCVADGYSAKITSTARCGAKASLIVHKTNQLYQAQVERYDENMKILREVQTKLRKHKQAQQPEQQAAPKRVRISEVGT